MKPRAFALGTAVFSSAVASHFASGYVVAAWFIGVLATLFLYLTGKSK